MINPAIYDMTAYQGATFDSVLTWSIDGDPVDLTGYTAAMQVRETPSSPRIVLSLASGSGITLGGAAGTITLNISAATMETRAAGNYFYDLELTSGASVTRLIQGIFTISAEVTR